MGLQKLITKLNAINNIIDRNNNLIGEIANSLKREFNIDNSISLNKEIKNLDEKGRNLKIGIVGRVKAGKSSLINALLFDGKDILPKAATPMTAALTTLSYSDKYEVEIEFFTNEDIAKIKELYDLYNKKFEEYVDEYKRKVIKKELEQLKKQNESDEINSKIQKFKNFLNMPIGHIPILEDDKRIEAAKKYATNILKEDEALQAAYEQYTMIKENQLEDIGEEKEIIQFSSLDELSKALEEYVGSSGKFMPITKIVHIKMPIKFLKDIEIIDTPGINDPIVSREQRTNDLLRICDVVFVVSPAGQFLSAQDIDLMLKITNDEGIKYIYVVASKFDDLLFGSLGSKYHYDLEKVIKEASFILQNKLHEDIRNLIKNHPEIDESFNTLLRSDSLIYTSGLAFSLLNNFDKNNQLIKNLKEHYPAYDVKEALKKLSNLETLKYAIENVRNKKIEIMEAKKREFIKAYNKRVDKFLRELRKEIERYQKKVKSTDLAELEEEIQNLKQKANKLEKLDIVYYDFKKSFILDLKKELIKIVSGCFLVDIENTGIKTEKKSERVWYKLWLGKRTYNITVLYLTQIKSRIDKEFKDCFYNKIKNFIEEKLYKDFSKKIPEKIIGTMMEMEIEIDKIQTEKIINDIIRDAILNPNFEKSCCQITINKIGTSKIEGENAINEELVRVEAIYFELQSKLRDRIEKYINELDNSLNIPLKTQFLEDYEKKQLKLQEDIKNREEVLARLERVIRDLRKIR